MEVQEFFGDLRQKLDSIIDERKFRIDDPQFLKKWKDLDLQDIVVGNIGHAKVYLEPGKISVKYELILQEKMSIPHKKCLYQEIWDDILKRGDQIQDEKENNAKIAQKEYEDYIYELTTTHRDWLRKEITEKYFSEKPRATFSASYSTSSRSEIFWIKLDFPNEEMSEKWNSLKEKYPGDIVSGSNREGLSWSTPRDDLMIVTPDIW